MKAIIDGEKIVKWTISDEGIEVGNIPSRMPMDRIRWDGEKLVSIGDYKELYVDNDTLQTFIMPGFNRQKIKMEYKDRKRLRKHDGKIKVITPQEEIKEKEDRQFLARRKKEYPPIEDFIDAMVKINNPETKTEGEKQLQEYYSKCLAVKNKYPKENK